MRRHEVRVTHWHEGRAVARLFSRCRASQLMIPISWHAHATRLKGRPHRGADLRVDVGRQCVFLQRTDILSGRFDEETSIRLDELNAMPSL
jgi:hypothetical protein